MASLAALSSSANLAPMGLRGTRHAARVAAHNSTRGAMRCHASLLTVPVLKAVPPVVLSLVTVASGIFTGVAAGVTFVEHPSRLTTLSFPDIIPQWIDSYERALAINASLAAFSAAAGVIGAAIAAANSYPAQLTYALATCGAAFTFIWAFTYFVMFPVNYAIYHEHTNEEYMKLLVQWGKLHAVRTAVAGVVFLLLVAAGYRPFTPPVLALA